ncbi:MAG: hypothetical protein MUF75_06140 [Bacteroidia bacterium]|jgi:hypothetical protein|nr:hypothetical protein [Bacteroidia bacterium]
MKRNSLSNIINKIGFFRLTLIPIGITILITAIYHGIWGMGLVGLIVLAFGVLNKCLLMGQCEVDVPIKNPAEPGGKTAAHK